MDSYKLGVKLFVREDVSADAISAETIVPIFHSWIQTHAVPGHLLIDVADYSHVTDGPGTVLISHEANLSTDRGAAKPGLLYVRKQPLEAGTFADRLRIVLGAVLDCANRLEQDARLKGRLAFATDHFSFRIYDRLLAPNTPETFQAVEPELNSLARQIWPEGDASIEPATPGPAIFEVHLKGAASPTLQTLISRLPGVAVG